MCRSEVNDNSIVRIATNGIDAIHAQFTKDMCRAHSQINNLGLTAPDVDRACPLSGLGLH